MSCNLNKLYEINYRQNQLIFVTDAQEGGGSIVGQSAEILNYNLMSSFSDETGTLKSPMRHNVCLTQFAAFFG